MIDCLCPPDEETIQNNDEIIQSNDEKFYDLIEQIQYEARKVRESLRKPSKI